MALLLCFLILLVCVAPLINTISFYARMVAPAHLLKKRPVLISHSLNNS